MKTTSSPKRFECTIKDATEPLLTHVKPVDIKGAVCRDHQRCAIARAIKRQRSKSALWVDVGAKIVLIGTGKKTAIRYVLPESAANQVKYFDTHEGAMAPCSIELRPPKGSVTLGSRTGVKARSGKAPNRRKKRKVPTR